MHQRSVSVISFAVLLCLLSGATQVSRDWRTKYGAPEAETYSVRPGIAVTVYYSAEGQTCRTKIEPFIANPPDNLENILEEIIPLSERGKQVSSIGLTSSANGIGSMVYERVSISLNTTQALAGILQSATIYWKGIQCKLPEQKNQK